MFFSKKFLYPFLLLALPGYSFFYFFNNSADSLDFSQNKNILLSDNGLNFTAKTSAKTIDDFLQENKIILSDYDQIIPDKSSLIYSGTNIFIKRAVKVIIAVDGKKIEVHTLQNTILNTIFEQKISLGPLDKISPDQNSSPKKDLDIVITRINVEEKIIPEDIDFKVTRNNDPKLSWREEKITTKGEKGIREVKYKITYKNGKEISRVALEKNITKNPVAQIVTKGTYMKLGSASKGQGTWYAWKGGLFAASATLPKGSFAKVSNLANGKSVMVQINDYGPQGKGRIIDLDKIAFAKIASLNAGVIGVKVEPVLN